MKTLLFCLIGLLCNTAANAIIHLKNLKQVDVLVTIQDNAQAEETRRCHGQSLASYGVTKNVLQTLVELRLRQAGIRVDRSAPAVLYFFIHACQTLIR